MVGLQIRALFEYLSSVRLIFQGFATVSKLLVARKALATEGLPSMEPGLGGCTREDRGSAG